MYRGQTIKKIQYMYINLPDKWQNQNGDTHERTKKNSKKSYFVAVENGRRNLPEYTARLGLWQTTAFANVVVEFATARVFHHQDYFVFVLEHLVNLKGSIN